MRLREGTFSHGLLVLVLLVIAAHPLPAAEFTLPFGSPDRLIRYNTFNGEADGFPRTIVLPRECDGELYVSVELGRAAPQVSLHYGLELEDRTVHQTIEWPPNGSQISMTVTVDGVGAMMFSVGTSGVELVNHTITDCGALGAHPTIIALIEVTTLLEAAALTPVTRESEGGPTFDASFVLIRMAEVASRMVVECESSLPDPLGFCSTHNYFEEDCLKCCGRFYGVAGGGVMGACGAAAGAFCSPGLWTTVACAGVGGAACGAAVEIAKESCEESCAPNPGKPGENQMCAENAICKEGCGVNELPVAGPCGSGLVCCRAAGEGASCGFNGTCRTMCLPGEGPVGSPCSPGLICCTWGL